MSHIWHIPQIFFVKLVSDIFFFKNFLFLVGKCVALRNYTTKKERFGKQQYEEKLNKSKHLILVKNQK